MKNEELIHRAWTLSEVIKAALVRAVISTAPLGHYDTFSADGRMIRQPFSADFTREQNLTYVDCFFIPKAREVLTEGDNRRKEKELRHIFGPQALYAVQLGTVQSFSFNELTHVLFPRAVAPPMKPDTMGQIITFPGTFHHRMSP